MPAKMSEFALIESMLQQRRLTQGKHTLVPAGDDASVLQFGNQILAVTVDTFVEECHFSFDYFLPEQVGIRALEASASDVVAIGGQPIAAWVALTLPPHMQSKVSALYKGLDSAAQRLAISIEGGETVRVDSQLSVSVTVLGTLAHVEHICRRRDARVGDLVCLSGTVGDSAAGLYCLRNNLEGFEHLKTRHREPQCRVDKMPYLATKAHAMIDISDGLSSELLHIAKASGVRIDIDSSKVPLSSELKKFSQKTSVDPMDLALHGGEDFELLYTLDPATLDKTDIVIGRVTGEQGGSVYCRQLNGDITPLAPGGYSHF